jgi:hypothetical protein
MRPIECQGPQFFAMLCPGFLTFNKKPSPLLAWNGVGSCTSVLITLPSRCPMARDAVAGRRIGFNLD